MEQKPVEIIKSQRRDQEPTSEYRLVFVCEMTEFVLGVVLGGRVSGGILFLAATDSSNDCSKQNKFPVK
jgi:hypothetical protein